MPKTIPSVLVTAKAKPVALTSRLLLIGPLPDGSFLGMTSIDKDEVYDDGDGEITYHAATGLQLSTFEATNDLAVDNGEAQTLIPVYPMPGITESMVNLGLLDTVPYVIYEHDCVNGLDGEHEIMGAGVLGACRIEQGLVAIPELRSWTQLLNQTGIISQTSIDCRVKHFGSQPGDEREFCGYDITGEWEDFTVTAVGDEVVREFYTSDLAHESDRFAPGLVKWTEGANKGASVEVEAYTQATSSADAYVSLRFTTRKPIQPGDEGEIRRDCTRKYTGHNSCQTYFGDDRGLHFRGECFTNIGDTTANTVPGVNMTTNTGGSGEAF